MFSDKSDLTLRSEFAGLDNPSLLINSARIKTQFLQGGENRILGVRTSTQKNLERLLNSVGLIQGKRKHHNILDGGKRDLQFEWYNFYHHLFGSELPGTHSVFFNPNMCDCCGVVVNLLNGVNKSSLCDRCNHYHTQPEGFKLK